MNKSYDEWSIVGLELDEQLLRESRRRAEKLPYSNRITLLKSPQTQIPFEDSVFDAVVSEFIVYPSPKPTNIGQDEMARVLVRNGMLLITDVIVTGSVDEVVSGAYRAAGLRYFCEASIEDFIYWMSSSGFEDIVVEDLTHVLKRIWEKRAKKMDYEKVKVLLKGELTLGRRLFYLYFKGRKA